MTTSLAILWAIVGALVSAVVAAFAFFRLGKRSGAVESRERLVLQTKAVSEVLAQKDLEANQETDRRVEAVRTEHEARLAEIKTSSTAERLRALLQAARKRFEDPWPPRK